MGNFGYWLFSRAVRNDAMRSDPEEIYGWRAIMLALSVSFTALPYEVILGGAY